MWFFMCWNPIWKLHMFTHKQILHPTLIYLFLQSIFSHTNITCKNLKIIALKGRSPGSGCTTRELLTGATKMWQKTVEAFCGFGRVVGVIRQRGSVVCTLLNRSFVGAHSRVRGLPTGSMWAYRAIQVAAHATWWCLPTWKCSATWIFQNQVDVHFLGDSLLFRTNAVKATCHICNKSETS